MPEKNCPGCGRALDRHNQHVRFQLPDPVLDAQQTGSPEIWLSHADATTSIGMMVQDLGAFVRALLPVQLTDGHTITFGVWVGITPDELRSTLDIWWEPQYQDLQLNGPLANSLPPWGLLGAPVTLAVRDPDQTPYCVASPDEELAAVLNHEWPHANILDTLR